MLLGNQKNLADCIITSLCADPILTALELHQKVSTSYKRVSIQALYLQLKALQSSGVIVKYKDKYQLSLTWVMGMSELMDKAYESCLGQESISSLLDSRLKTQRWQISSLERLIAIYSHVVFMLMEKHNIKEMYDWVPHVWYHFAQPNDERRTLKSLDLLGIKYYLVVKGNTYLDQTYKEYFDTVSGRLLFGAEDFEGRSDDCYSVVGDYIFTVLLPKPTKTSISELYQVTQNIEGMKIFEVLKLMRKKQNIYLKVELNQEKAKKFKRKFVQYMGKD